MQYSVSKQKATLWGVKIASALLTSHLFLFPPFLFHTFTLLPIFFPGWGGEYGMLPVVQRLGVACGF